MDIKTKFKVGEKLYLMYNGWLQLRTVIEIDICVNKNETLIRYKMSNDSVYFETELFQTEEELFQSLKKKLVKDEESYQERELIK